MVYATLWRLVNCTLYLGLVPYHAAHNTYVRPHSNTQTMSDEPSHRTVMARYLRAGMTFVSCPVCKRTRSSVQGDDHDVGVPVPTEVTHGDDGVVRVTIGERAHDMYCAVLESQRRGVCTADWVLFWTYVHSRAHAVVVGRQSYIHRTARVIMCGQAPAVDRHLRTGSLVEGACTLAGRGCRGRARIVGVPLTAPYMAESKTIRADVWGCGRAVTIEVPTYWCEGQFCSAACVRVWLAQQRHIHTPRLFLEYMRDIHAWAPRTRHGRVGVVPELSADIPPWVITRLSVRWRQEPRRLVIDSNEEIEEILARKEVRDNNDIVRKPSLGMGDVACRRPLGGGGGREEDSRVRTRPARPWRSFVRRWVCDERMHLLMHTDVYAQGRALSGGD